MQPNEAAQVAEEQALGPDGSPNRSPNRSDVRAAWLVSLQSVIWSVTTSTIAIGLGIASGSAVLCAFGAIGFVDALGSVALVYHFRHTLHHDAVSERLEAIAHRIVIAGLLTVGLTAVVVAAIRLALDTKGGSSGAGTVLAAISLCVLIVLSLRKQSLAPRVGSEALLADGRLSGVGALQAGVTLFGTATARLFGWDWADALAAGIVGLVAISVAIVSIRAARATKR
jgi:divalent metal cation (Fe/Co/Zn/Cd) transporter